MKSEIFSESTDSPVSVETLQSAVELQPAPQAQPKVTVARSGKPVPKKKPAEQGSLFRVVWRWHFYAGAIVTPFLILLSVTGALYIFKSEIENLCRSNLQFVTAQDTPRVSYQSQIDAAKAAFPDYQASSLTIRPEANRATEIAMRKTPVPGEARSPNRRGGGSTVYVNPYTNEVLGELNRENDSLGPFFSFVLSLHRNLFLGKTGRIATELATSWTIILILTGVYLWIPKKWSKAEGVWIPRTGKKRYVLLRDLHAIVGVYLFPVALVIAVTGMFYTFAVGKVINDTAHHIMEPPKPKAEDAQAVAAVGANGDEQKVAAAETDDKSSRESSGQSPRPGRREGARQASNESSGQPAKAQAAEGLTEEVQVAQSDSQIEGQSEGQSVAQIQATSGEGQAEAGQTEAGQAVAEAKPVEAASSEGQSLAGSGPQGGGRSSGGGRGARRRGGEGGPAEGAQDGPSAVAETPIPIDMLVEKVRSAYPDRIISASLSTRAGGGRRRGPAEDPNTYRMGAGNDYNNTYGLMVNTNMTLDRTTGEILKQEHNSEGGYFWHGWTYPLHVGSIYGPFTKVIWMLACFVLIALPVTGLWMWWERRPKGKSGLPRKQSIRLPVWVIALIGVTCVLMPIAGASVLIVMLLEGLYRLGCYLFRRKKVTAA